VLMIALAVWGCGQVDFCSSAHFGHQPPSRSHYLASAHETFALD